MPNNIDYIFENINYAPSNKEIPLTNGKPQFNQMNRQDNKRIYYIQNQNRFDINNYTQYDIKLFNAFILFNEGKIDEKIYQRAYIEYYDSMGIVPPSKISWTINQVHSRIKSNIYKNIFGYPYKIERADIIIIFLESLYSFFYERVNSNHLFHWTQRTNLKDGNILYIHKNPIKCQKDSHKIISVTAILTGRNNSEISINVNHCIECNKFFINYTTYQLYREKYGILIGNLQIDSENFDVATGFLSEYSPLKLCGYSVNQIDGYSDNERQYIISKMIDQKIMSKPDIIRYLEYFIHMNGKKKGNEIALSKWKSDLEYTLSYNMESQEQHIISDVKKC